MKQKEKIRVPKEDKSIKRENYKWNGESNYFRWKMLQRITTHMNLWEGREKTSYISLSLIVNSIIY